MMDDGEEKRALMASEIIFVLRHVSPEIKERMGLDPNMDMSSLLIQVMPIPPPAVRPSITMDTAAKGDDDLTHKLIDIIKANAQVKRVLDSGVASDLVIQEAVAQLQLQVTTYIDNEVPGLQQAVQRSGKPIKALCQRLKGKDGRIRGNLMGKRVDFSARTVITPDPNINIDEVGVPQLVAMNLTFPEHVTVWNVKWLTQLVENGPSKYPGAKFVVRKDTGHTIDLRYTKRCVLMPGDTVMRHIIDRDIVMFNRQPSLHKMSIMAHYVRVMKHNTFRLNLSVTTPYNADFDGDEMNLHVPQCVEGQVEAMEIMRVPTQIVSPQSNKPVMGIVQDSLLGSRRLTRRCTLLTHDQAVTILHTVGKQNDLPPPAVCWPERLWTGKQMFSCIMPTLVFNRECNGFDEDTETDRNFTCADTYVKIHRGVVLTGMMDKRSLGNVAGSLIHVIVNDHGHERAAQFINNVQRIVCKWLLIHGFSIGPGDMVTTSAVKAKIMAMVE